MWPGSGGRCFKMILGSVVLSSIGILCLSLSLSYVLVILRHLWSRQDVALARIFVSPSVHHAFVLLAVSAGLLSICMILAAIGTMAEYPVSLLTEAPTIGAIGIAGSFLSFTRTVARATAQRSSSIEA